MKPSELIRLALGDLEKCENDSRYGINMSTWHSLDETGLCEVCLAGSVMAQTLNYSPKDNIFDVCSIPDGWGQRLVALDYFRKGMIEGGLRLMGLKSDKYLDRMIYPYRQDRDNFQKNMKQLANDLEENGL